MSYLKSILTKLIITFFEIKLRKNFEFYTEKSVQH